MFFGVDDDRASGIYFFTRPFVSSGNIELTGDMFIVPSK